MLRFIPRRARNANAVNTYIRNRAVSPLLYFEHNLNAISTKIQEKALKYSPKCYHNVKLFSTTNKINNNNTNDQPASDSDSMGINEIYLTETDAHTYKLVEWYKHVGDEVKEEDSLCEIETDLFTFDIPAPHNGILAKQVKATGSNLMKEELVALMVGSKEDFEKYREQANPIDVDLSVEKWLVNLCPDSKLDQYAEQFIIEGFDSIKAMKMIDVEDLKDMGVKKGHIKLIIGGIDLLKKEDTSD
jgi:hypothetical protein